MQIQANGITLDYTVTGSGQAMILLHGNGEDKSIFDKLVPILAENHTVYAIDSRSHGGSQKIKPLHYRDMAADVEAFIQTLHIEKPALCGFSDGGIVGLLLAIKHPDWLSRLILCGASLRPDGMKASIVRMMKIPYFFTRDDKLRLMLKEPDISPCDLAKITAPTLVLAGEKDMIKEEHTRLIAENLPNAELKILSGEDHGSYIVGSDKLAPLIAEFERR